MDDLRELYQEVILDHNKAPRNFDVLQGATHIAHGDNPLCGDKITVFVKVGGDRLEQATFQGAGCAICTASASLMTEAVCEKKRSEVDTLCEEFHELVTGDPSAPPPLEKLGKLAAFAGVCEYPVRVKCASLPWRTLKAALEGGETTVTTE